MNIGLDMIANVLNDMSDGFWLISSDGRTVWHNSASEHILGLTDALLKENNIDELKKLNDENEILFSDISDALRSRCSIIKTVPYFRNDDMLYLHINAVTMHDQSENEGIIVQITDITEATMLFIANKRLANQVIDLMNSFVEVMVTAIEEKSAYNANHTKSMVRYVKRYLDWLGKQGRLTEHTNGNTAPFIMSVWLHDLGKLIVPQEIMDKPTRLCSAWKDISHRIEITCLMLQNKMLLHPERKDELAFQTERLKEAEKLIAAADNAGFIDDATIQKLREAAMIECIASDGSTRPLLDEYELEAITVVRGTLTDSEREIMQSHVSWTGRLLSKMEFRGEYKQVPLWAAGHHEMLDGSGYPEHLKADKIPWETRLLTIIDIYDALTAEDRPYKPPMPPEKAFSILEDMAENGRIDKDILNSFIESEAWKLS